MNRNPIFEQEFVSIIQIIKFLEEDHQKRDCKTTLKRKNFFYSILNGLPAKEICEKFEIKTCRSSEYVQKVLRRICDYAGVESAPRVKKIKRYGDIFINFVEKDFIK